VSVRIGQRVHLILVATKELLLARPRSVSKALDSGVRLTCAGALCAPLSGLRMAAGTNPQGCICSTIVSHPRGRYAGRVTSFQVQADHCLSLTSRNWALTDGGRRRSGRASRCGTGPGDRVRRRSIRIARETPQPSSRTIQRSHAASTRWWSQRPLIQINTPGSQPRNRAPCHQPMSTSPETPRQRQDTMRS
jgi:hypothetical protein